MDELSLYSHNIYIVAVEVFFKTKTSNLKGLIGR